MISLDDKSQCTGCGACSEGCPVKAITLSPDEEGFLYPVVNQDQCIKCQKCIHICPVINTGKLHQSRNCTAYAAYTLNKEIRQNSSSGGVFTEFATYILKHNGVVFGAAFDEHFCVKHIMIDTVADLSRLRGSKYVQSELGKVYSEVKALLESGKQVLFTGTPCQVAGLYGFLNKDYTNLFTQDIVCHGVAAPTVWQQYLEFRKNKAGSAIQGVCFRNKKTGWRTYSFQIDFKNGKEYISSVSDDLYMRGYLQNMFLRPSCYQCAFKTKSRSSDFTLADFWGIEKICPQMDDNKGTSLIMLHSEKARVLFQNIKDNLRCQEVNPDEAAKYNSAMIASAQKNINREIFMQCLKEKGFKAATKKYSNIPMQLKIKRFVKKILKRIKGGSNGEFVQK